MRFARVVFVLKREDGIHPEGRNKRAWRDGLGTRHRQERAEIERRPLILESRTQETPQRETIAVGSIRRDNGIEMIVQDGQYHGMG